MSIKKRVSATEAKNRLGDLLAEVVHGKEPLIIERHGKPLAVLVDFQQWNKLGEEAKRPTNAWVESVKKLAAKMKDELPNAPHTPAVEILRQLRNEH